MPTFTRPERLKSRKAIGRLFSGGHAYVAYPLRVVWLEVAPDPTLPPSAEQAIPSPAEGGRVGSGHAQIAVSVPKRTFKTAVQRNRVKRRIREAYRLRKHELFEKLAGRSIVFMVMYIAKEELPFAEISAGMQKMIRKFPG